MYCNILIISDNLYLCKEFEKIISEPIYSEINWTFSISSFSKLEPFSSTLDRNVSQLDLKSKSNIEFICKNYDLVISIHCKQIFPNILVNSIKCINIHPGYNPINRGWYPQVFAIINDSKVGATIHEIDDKLDHGDIIDRQFVNIDSWDTSKTLYDKILNMEIFLIRKNLKKIIDKNYETLRPEIEGELYLKNDFNDLCKVDLDKNQSIEKTINTLRALTHGDYKNAYFIDKLTGKKVFVSIDFKVE
jgi:methionyl-tRNA formyltransferase